MRKLYLFVLAMVVATGLFSAHAADPDLYVRGAQFGWNASDCTSANQLKTSDNETYTISLDKLESGFKIADNSWGAYNFGSVSNITPGNTYTLQNNSNSGNITTAGAVTLSNVKLTFKLSTGQLTVEGTAAAATYPEALYLVGDFNGWTTNDSNYKMLPDGNNGKYVIKNVNIANGAQVKFCNGSWAVNWGASTEGDPLPVGTEFVPAFNANNYKLTVALSNATVEFYYDLSNIESARIKITNGEGGGTVDPGTGGGDTGDTGNFKDYWVNVIGPFNEWKDNGVQPGADGITTTTNLPINAQGFKVKVWNGQKDIYYVADGDKVIPLDTWTQMAEDTSDAAPAQIQGASSSTVYTVKYNLNNNQIYVTLEGGSTDPGTDPDPTPATLYLRGSFIGGGDGWGVDENYKMTANGNVYTINNVNIPAGGEFKVANADWSVSYGGTGVIGDESVKTCTISNNTDADAWLDSSINFTVEKAISNATVTFTLNSGEGASTIKVSGTEEGGGDTPVDPDPDPTGTTLYLRGSFIGGDNWDVDDAYKMTANGNVYTLTGVNIPAAGEFKVANNDWTISYGGTGDINDESVTTCTIYNDTEADAWFNSSVNFTVAKAINNATITFTLNSDNSMPSTIKVTGTEVGGGDDPVDPNPGTYTALYIRGGGFGWDDCTSANQMSTTDGVNYTKSVASLESGFKISDEGYANYNFGSASNVEPGQDYTLTNDEMSGNITTKGGMPITNAVINFNLTTGVMNITGTMSDATYPEALYLVGTFNEWVTNDATYKLTREGDTGKYVINGVNIASGEQLKVCAGSWANNWGSSMEGETLPIGYEFVPAYNGQNFMLGEDLVNATVEFVYNIDDIEVASMTVTNGSSGVEGIYGNDGEAEYYNMQGVRVANPENGIYIVKRGSVVTKEVIRK